MSQRAMSPMVRQYLETCLWSTLAILSEDDEGNETWEEKGFDVSDFHPDAVYYATKDCDNFLALCDESETDLLCNWPDTVTDNELDGLREQAIESAGHDFWLTRERHGAGFWDGDWTHGDELTKIAHSFGSGGDCMYVDADGKIHFNGDTNMVQWDKEHPAAE
jgi:hypothetical protein